MEIKTGYLPKLFCKPPDGASVLYERKYEDGIITIESLKLKFHLPIIHQWVNQPYARFWQMSGPFEELQETYEAIQNNDHVHSFAAFYNGKLLCQADIYLVGIDEIREHLPNDILQCGIHIITAPPKEHPVRGLSLQFLLSFIDYYFSFPQAMRLYGEPDHRNDKIHLIVKKAGFCFLRTIQLTSKTANLFCLHKAHFKNQ